MAIEDIVKRIIRDTARFVSRVRDLRWVRSEVWDEGFEGKYVRGRERDELGSGRPFSLSIGILAGLLQIPDPSWSWNY
jgi:hypothetical protein